MNSQTEIDTVVDQVLADGIKKDLKASAPNLDLALNAGSRLVFVTDPNGLAVERYRLLRRRLCAFSPRGGLIMVTSPSPGDGKTLTSANLAWCLAESGQTTCLVDLDFRAPGLGRALGYDPPLFGVAEVLAKECTNAQAIGKIEDRSLYVMGIAKRLESPVDQFVPGTLDPFFKELRENFNWVILDMPPTVPMADVAEVLPRVDGALMVVRSGKTPKSLIGPTLDVLGTKLWGVVLNDSVINGSAYYGNYGTQSAQKKRRS